MHTTSDFERRSKGFKAPAQFVLMQQAARCGCNTPPRTRTTPKCWPAPVCHWPLRQRKRPAGWSLLGARRCQGWHRPMQHAQSGIYEHNVWHWSCTNTANGFRDKHGTRSLGTAGPEFRAHWHSLHQHAHKPTRWSGHELAVHLVRCDFRPL